jgi:hypothetical protein
MFIPESAVKFLGIEAQSDFSNVKTLRVSIARFHSGQEQHTNFIHLPEISKIFASASPQSCAKRF